MVSCRSNASPRSTTTSTSTSSRTGTTSSPSAPGGSATSNSIVNPNDELDLPVYYTQSMTAGLAYAAALDDAAIIGLGGGRTAWYHHKSVPGLQMTAVELDPGGGRGSPDSYFGVKPEPNFDIDIEDGRVFLARSDKRFDIIMVDAYRGPFVPFHLLTTEFYKLVAEHLKPGGVVVQNVEPTTMLFDSAVATIKPAFDHVVFLRGDGNIVIVAYNGPEKDEASARKASPPSGRRNYGFRYDLTEILGRRFTPPWNDEHRAAHRRLRAGRISEGDRAPQREADIGVRPQPEPRRLHRRLAVGPGTAALVVADVATLGFITLGFEMVASRILTPLFGSGIYTWATIISIVVAGLMAGYFIGGIFADRFPSFPFAALIKLVAAAYLVLRLLRQRRRRSRRSSTASPTRSRRSSRAASSSAFRRSSCSACTRRSSVRLLLGDPADAGKISGGLFAISSLGNIAGIIVTTFVLIPTIGTRAITLGFAMFLVLSGLASAAAEVMRKQDA